MASETSHILTSIIRAHYDAYSRCSSQQAPAGLLLIGGRNNALRGGISRERYFVFRTKCRLTLHSENVNIRNEKIYIIEYGTDAVLLPGIGGSVIVQ